MQAAPRRRGSLAPDCGTAARQRHQHHRRVVRVRIEAVAILEEPAGRLQLRVRDAPIAAAPNLFGYQPSHRLLDGRVRTQPHDALLGCMIQASQPQIIPPGATIEGVPNAGNPTGFALIIAPLLVDKQVVGLVEILMDPTRRAALYEQLAAWSFHTVRQGLATFDPANGVVPFPNDLLMKDGHVNLPADPKAEPVAKGVDGRRDHAEILGNQRQRA